jgi:hypothetical protein
MGGRKDVEGWARRVIGRERENRAREEIVGVGGKIGKTASDAR